MVGFSQKKSSRLLPWPVSKLLSKSQRSSDETTATKRKIEWCLQEVSKTAQRVEELWERYERSESKKEQRSALAKIDNDAKKLQKLRDRILSATTVLTDSRIRDTFELIEMYLIRVNSLKAEFKQVLHPNSSSELVKRKLCPPDVVSMSDSIAKMTINNALSEWNKVENIPGDTQTPSQSITAHVNDTAGQVEATDKLANSTQQPICESVVNALQAIRAREKIHIWLLSTQQHLEEKIKNLAHRIELSTSDKGHDTLQEDVIRLYGLIRICEFDSKKLKERVEILEKLASSADSFLEFLSETKTLEGTLEKRLALVEEALANGACGTTGDRGHQDSSELTTTMNHNLNPESQPENMGGLLEKVNKTSDENSKSHAKMDATPAKTSSCYTEFKSCEKSVGSCKSIPMQVPSRSKEISGIPRPIPTLRTRLTPIKSTVGYAELEKIVAKKILETKTQSKVQQASKPPLPTPIESRKTRIQSSRSATPKDAQLLLSRRRVMERRETRIATRSQQKSLRYKGPRVLDDSSSSSLNDSGGPEGNCIVPLPMIAKPANCVL